MATRLITGANRGLGYEFVRQYAESGDQIYAFCRDLSNSKELVDLENKFKDISVHEVDASDFEAINRLGVELAEIPIDTLINNAGVFGPKPAAEGDFRQSFGELDYHLWQEILLVNTISPVKMVECFLPNIKLGSKKQIINMTSQIGSFAEGTHGLLAYSTSKTALNRGMVNLASILAEEDISVHLINPGWVKTDMGGSTAPLEVDQAVSKVISLIDSLDMSNTGLFHDYDGRVIPW